MPARIFLKTVASICDGDLQECRKLASAETGQESGRLEGIVSAFHKSFNLRTNELTVLGRADLGTNLLFLWETDPVGAALPPGLRARNFFSFNRLNESKLLWDGARQDVLNTIVRASLQATLRQPDFAPLLKPRRMQHEFAIPSTTNGSAAYLQFNGRLYAEPLLGEVADTKDALLTFLRASYRLAQRGNWLSFGNTFTTESSSKFVHWMETKKPEEMQAFQSETLEARRFISFVIDADPIFIVFYTSTLDAESNERSRYDYVWRDSGDGKLKLTNFYFQSFFDDFLNDPMNFEIPFLRPRLAEASQTAKESIPSRNIP